MALPVVIPNTFANANASIPLSQLDNNFSTVAVAINGMANGAEALANVNITGGSIANASLSNVSISSGNVTINVANVTTLDATNVEVTNIKAKDGTASATIADSTGVMTIGSSVLTTADINGGTIDNTAIGGSTAAAGAFTTLSATGVTTVQAGSAAAPAITTTGDTNTGIYFPAADTIAFTEGGAESMRIDSSGKILFNTTTQNNNEQVGMVYSSNAGVGFSIKDSNAQNGNTFIEFRNGATLAGTITSNGTTTMTYGSASDYRLKENLSPLTGALATVEQLKPQVGSWKADGSKFVGFVAHELQEVFPDAVVGEKDRIDADGNPLYQMVDTGSASIIATLTAAIQEQQAMIDTMKQEIAELKAKVGE